MEIEETVLFFTRLMMKRREYEELEFITTDEEGNEGKKPRILAKTKIGDRVLIFFIVTKTPTEKVTMNVLKSIISVSKTINHIIIIHNTVLTPDAKQTVAGGSGVYSFYNFETFTFDEMRYDLYECLFEDPDSEDNIVILKESNIQEKNKLPILISSDPIARYLEIRQGDVVRGRFDGTKHFSYRRCVNI